MPVPRDLGSHFQPVHGYISPPETAATAALHTWGDKRAGPLIDKSPGHCKF